MIKCVDSQIIAFVDEWSDIVLPQLEKAKAHDVTEIMGRTQKCRMITGAIRDKKNIFLVGFRGCRGMIKKWLCNPKGRMIREKGGGIVEINPTTVTMAAIDINVPFITSDEVFLPSCKDKPYNLERSLVKEAMAANGFDPEKDIAFFFFLKPGDAQADLNWFIDDLYYLMTKEYCRAKGIIAIQDPKWIKYHASAEVAKYTDAFFFNGVRLIYSKREAKKKGILP